MIMARLNKSDLKRMIIAPQAKLIFACATALMIISLSSYFIFGDEIRSLIADPALLQTWLGHLGMFDELVFILLRAAQTVIKFIPAEPVEIAAGYAWGAVWGMIYYLAGSLVGTVCILALTKHLGPRIFKHFQLDYNQKLLSYFQNSERIYLLLFILYLIPGTPKDSFTYPVALFPIKPVPFLLITGIARIPSILSSTICGTTLAEKQYWISALIFAASIILAIIGGGVYRRLQANIENR